MILEYGDVSKLKNEPWYMVELRSEKTIESTMRRVGKAIPNIFRNDPIEIFIPVFKRDLDVFEMKTGCYIFVRSSSFSSLLRLKTITGVVSLVTEGDSNRPSKAIKVEDSYVQSIIAEAEEEFRNRGVGIGVDSFVRVLNGDTRDFCGVVEAIGDGKAIVRINLKTKSILLETPLRNLLNISDVLANERVYYFCPLVEELVKDQGEEGLKLIEEDLKLEDATVPSHVQEEQSHEPKRHSRQKTVTALVKRLIMIESQHDPMTICKRVVEALKTGDIKVPKNCFIIYCIVKDHLMRDYFRQIDPSISNYREVINKYGKTYKFSAQQISEIDPSLKIPVLSSEEELPEPKKGQIAPKRRGRPRKNKNRPPEPKAKVKKKRVLSPQNKEKMIAGLKKWHASRRKEKQRKK
jgi:transcription antitermination factor NusG